MPRIVVTGNAGSGKSTLARQLSRQYHLPLIAFDRIVWRPGWVAATKDEIAREVTPLLEGERWIVDGVSSQLYRAADTIIFLDFTRATCLRRAFVRTLRHLFRQRDDVPENCPEWAVAWKLFKIIWRFPSRVRPVIVANLKQSEGAKKVIWIRSQRELHEFLRTMPCG